MIHRVHLAPLIRDCLGDAVVLQMSLLAHAALSASLDEAGCAQHLEKNPRFKGRGALIAKWLWAAPNRIGPLKQFAGGPTGDKRRLARRARREAMRLLRVRTGNLTPWPTNPAPWENAAAEFLERFYFDLCSTSGLPACIFSKSVISGRFDRARFFENFESSNPKLEICAICDETGFLTKPKGTPRGEIDHFFPKSRYPHLACHPFNLVPTCHLCNGTVKGSRDPLDGNGRRYRLEEIFVPYRGESFADRAYLKLRTSKLNSAIFEELRPRRSYTLRQASLSFEATYEIPSRWLARNKNIGERIFKEIKSRISCLPFSPAPDAQVREMVRQIDVLIGEFHEGQGTDPYRFAMMWWLSKLSKEQLVPVAEGKQKHSSFWAELSRYVKNVSSMQQPLRTRKTIERQGQRMRQEVG